jgi:hypothetical protein
LPQQLHNHRGALFGASSAAGRQNARCSSRNHVLQPRGQVCQLIKRAMKSRRQGLCHIHQFGISAYVHASFSRQNSKHHAVHSSAFRQANF